MMYIPTVTSYQNTGSVQSCWSLFEKFEINNVPYLLSEKGKQRLNTLIKSLLLRRTKDQTDKEGKALVSLFGHRV